LVAAVVVCAWFVLGVVETHQTNRATAILGARGRLDSAQRAHVASLLSGAGSLNPDRQVDILRAQLDVREGHPAAARAILRGVVAQEPENIDAWVALARASAGDPQTFRLALTRARALAPLVPPPR
jgi:predicted Zn-dependent protease